MTYYYSKTVRSGFNETVSRITQALKEEGFGIAETIGQKLKKAIQNT